MSPRNLGDEFSERIGDRFYDRLRTNGPPSLEEMIAPFLQYLKKTTKQPLMLRSQTSRGSPLAIPYSVFAGSEELGTVRLCVDIEGHPCGIVYDGRAPVSPRDKLETIHCEWRSATFYSDVEKKGISRRRPSDSRVPFVDFTVLKPYEH